MVKSPLSIIFTAAAIALAVSPEARKAARKLAVKGAAMMLELADQVKDSTRELRSTEAVSIEEKNTEKVLLP
ncbi:hypothetical protein [Paenibacillus sp. Aloe-11]|uniref:hypothetical protein n=1 Tax=Paenibacillus sp. Aloe-11 TaxID=1050222 RepID=UPI00024EFED9|nr:hypothetical protein [Paenibacillus sp. Aloe-11]EHS57446.1 hypothetical protein WG8_2402 [Paenibacillus sp. Aloe-11]